MQTFFGRLFGLQAHKRFPIVRVGYAVKEVEAFLNEIEQGTDVDNTELLNRVFSTTNNGYDRAAVHRYLATLVSNPALIDFERIEPLSA